MFRSFIIEGECINYTLRVSIKARRVRMTITAQGVTLVVPKHVSVTRAEAFMKEKASWLRKHIHAQKMRSKPKPSFDQIGSYDDYKDAAYQYISDKVKHYGTFYCVTYESIRIKNQKTLWGSCSRKGNLNFNYRIMLLPEILREYIVVHEVCHLLEFNHSQKFWNLVALQIPNYRTCVQELKAYAYSLS